MVRMAVAAWDLGCALVMSRVTRATYVDPLVTDQTPPGVPILSIPEEPKKKSLWKYPPEGYMKNCSSPVLARIAY